MSKPFHSQRIIHQSAPGHMDESKFYRIVRLTHWVIALLIVVGVSYDLVVSWNGVPNYIDSISGVAKRAGWYAPVLPFAYVGLAAHFWLNYDGYVFGWPQDLIVLGASHVLWTIMAWATKPLWSATDTGVMIAMLASMATGFAAYAIFFPQRPPSIDEHWKKRNN